jgi:hypothetical protein
MQGFVRGRLGGDVGLAVFAVKQVAHGCAAGGVNFLCGAGIDGCGILRGDVFFLRLATGGAAVGEAGLIGAELEFLVAHDTDANRERHTLIW